MFNSYFLLTNYNAQHAKNWKRIWEKSSMSTAVGLTQKQRELYCSRFCLLTLQYNETEWKPRNSSKIQFAPSQWVDWRQEDSWIPFQSIQLHGSQAGHKVDITGDAMFSSDSNNERGFLTLHCRGVCILPACFAAGTQREAAGGWRPSFIISLSPFPCLYFFCPRSTLLRSQRLLRCSGLLSLCCMLLLKLHTQKQALVQTPFYHHHKWQFKLKRTKVFANTSHNLL